MEDRPKLARDRDFPPSPAVDISGIAVDISGRSSASSRLSPISGRFPTGYAPTVNRLSTNGELARIRAEPGLRVGSDRRADRPGKDG